jgi:hypothetical protein
MRADPDFAGMILKERSNDIVAQRAGALMPEYREAVAIKSIQAVCRAKPEKSFAILQHRPNEGVGKPVIDGEMLELDAAFLALCELGHNIETTENRCEKEIPLYQSVDPV